MAKRKGERHIDYYHDDPVAPVVKRRNFGAFGSSVIFIVAGLFLSNTYAANISLSSGAGVEFGQGISMTTACSGSQALTVTPYSSFINSSGAGSFYFNSVKVSGIPTSCYGVDFTINAYGETSTSPLAIFNTNATNAIASNVSGTFQLATGSTSGASIASGSGTFTITFTNPVATAGSVSRLTIQSSPSMALTCAQGGTCAVGDMGPGGGRIFFVAASDFNCGPAYTSTGSPTGGLCKYLEVAPSGWNTGSDPLKPWAVSANQSSDVSGITNDSSAYNNSLGIGLGYKNSTLIVTQNGVYNASSNNYAAGSARAYAGGSKSDWYLPTLAELNLLCQWAHGVAPSVSTACSGGSINSSIYGANSAGFAANGYWSSSELSGTNVWAVAFGSPFQADGGKNLAISVRPIRAF
jgi:hypothetical protein